MGHIVNKFEHVGWGGGGAARGIPVWLWQQKGRGEQVNMFEQSRCWSHGNLLP